jgi:hypothetical protein
MNTGTAIAVIKAVSIVIGVSLASSCVPVDGGAVELAWEVRSRGPYGCVREENGSVVDRISDVSLCVRACAVVADGECVGDTECPVRSWPCEGLRGTTTFEIVAGRKELWIEVKCPDGSPANVIVPEPIVRDIADGEVTQLNALLIVVPDGQRACPGSA